MRHVLFLILISAAWIIGAPASRWYDRQHAELVRVTLVDMPSRPFDCAADPDVRECRLPMREGPYVLVGPAALGR
jgi:hypothetical protein